MCCFLVLDWVGIVGSSHSFSELSSASVGELSVSDLALSSSDGSDGSDGSVFSKSTFSYGSATASSTGLSVAVASSLTSAGAPVVLVSKLYC